MSLDIRARRCEPPGAQPIWLWRQGGFTLIEMVVVVLLVSILASAAMPIAALQKRRAQEGELRAALRTIRQSLDDYKRAWDQNRIGHKVDESGYPPSLSVLVEGVPDVSSPKRARIYFLRRLPRDPFADPSLLAQETWGLRSYDSPPSSPMQGKDVYDVYSRAEGVALDGSSYSEW